MFTSFIKFVVLSTIILFSSTIGYAIEFEWKTIGDIGNIPDSKVNPNDGTSGYGSLDNVYLVSKTEVTYGQYVEFLNAVATSDPNNLYSASMSSHPQGGINRTGTSGNYSYSLKNGGWANKPVAFVNFYDALRFANWLHNGQPTGAQNNLTTEDGAYDMSLGSNVVRKPGAKVYLTNDDEWYKAAYYDPWLNNGNGEYWDYATGSNIVPDNNPPVNDTGNSANYDSNGEGVPGGLAVGPPYYSTDVGAYSKSDSAYGTFDQAGNIWEYVEGPLWIDVDGYERTICWGGAWPFNSNYLELRACPYSNYDDYNMLGFRLASEVGFYQADEWKYINNTGVSYGKNWNTSEVDDLYDLYVNRGNVTVDSEVWYFKKYNYSEYGSWGLNYDWSDYWTDKYGFQHIYLGASGGISTFDQSDEWAILAKAGYSLLFGEIFGEDWDLFEVNELYDVYLAESGNAFIDGEIWYYSDMDYSVHGYNIGDYWIDDQGYKHIYLGAGLTTMLIPEPASIILLALTICGLMIRKTSK